ncbi:MAG: hypothetical protein IV101_16620 [Dechloromonas sp.]|uniref:DUF3108 domain-containing protein n=1 Tax=Azonexaceae TaxID=2008795 RepID=UPI001CF89874|nr:MULTISPECIES: DUF3108 domain-containing protein [Azonexaceae]MBT9522499.1 hypothetical protein [Dechloromonas sp.]UCV23529.1 hypothetical protein KI613_03005 [Ferribacterium limneticum]
MTHLLPTKIRPSMLALALLASCLAHAQNVERPAIEVGDRWKYETKDGLTQLVTGQTERIITATGNDRIEATENGSPAIYTTEWNPLETPESRFEPASRAFKFPLAVGDKWRHEGKTLNKATGSDGRSQYEVKVVGQEKITVPAGSFDAYKLVMEGYFTVHNMGNSRSFPFTRTYWYAPSAKASVKIENDAPRNNWRMELIEFGKKP